MDNYQIINTQKADLPFIYFLFDEAIAYQKRNNYPVWPDYDKTVLQNDIEQQQQYKIMIAGAIACVFSVCYRDEVVWRNRDQGNAVYLHRIAVNPKYKGQKQFEKILIWAKQHIKEQNLPFIRMDTWADNPPLVNYYLSFGFEVVEYFTTPDSEALPIQQRNNRVVLLEFKEQA